METDQTPAATPPAIEVKHTFKGTGMNLQCRGFQFKLGKTYTHEGSVKACNSGFHACENPLDVFSYYPPGLSRFFQTEQSGEVSIHGGDSKVASAFITLKAELLLPDFITAAYRWVLSKCSPATSNHATGDRSASSATGDRSASSATGYRSASSATGDQSASSATGDRSASSATGDRSASSATGYQSASSATGDRSASSATGYQSASSVSGKNSVAMNIGYHGKAKAAENGAIVLCNHDETGNLRHIRASKVGENGIKPDTFYILNGNNEFEEAQA